MQKLSVLLLASVATLTAGPDNVISAVPEPTTYLTFGAGLAAVMLIHNRFSKKK